MTTNGARWQAPVRCPSTELTLLPRPGEESRTERIDDLEAASLLRAFVAGNSVLIAAQDRLNEKCDAVIEGYRHARSAIDELKQFRVVGSAAQARDEAAAVVTRHAQDGAEDPCDRPIRAWMMWVVIGLSAIFDISFVANLVQKIFDVGRGDFLYYLAYLPGIGMALSVYATGLVLARHLFRRRRHVEMRRERGRLTPAILLKRIFWEWRPAGDTRQHSDLSWARLALPLVTTGLLMLALASVAYVRATTAGAAFAGLAMFEPIFVLMLVLLSGSAIALTVLAHNPYADRQKAAKKQLSGVEGAASQLGREARLRLETHAQAWNQLQAACASADGEARKAIEEACAVILESRGQRGEAGNMALPLTVLHWPQPGIRDAFDVSAHVEPVKSTIPGLELGVIQYVRDIATRYCPKTLEQDLDGEMERIHRQLRRKRDADAESSQLVAQR